MSDEAIAQEFALDDEDLPIQEETQESEPVEEAKEPAVKMHISKDDWIASGRDPEKWVSPDVFKERTQRINETNKLNQRLRQAEKEKDDLFAKMNNVVFLQQQQISRLRSDLEAKRDDAIDIGDKESVKALDRQLKDLDKEESLLVEQKPAVQPGIPPEVAEWNAENAWLTEDHPLRPKANEIFFNAINEGKTVAGALRAVDKELAKARTDERDTKKVPARSMVDNPRGAVSRSDAVSLSMSDCTREEKEMYHEFYRPSGISEKEFLKSVAEARKGKKS